MKQSDHNVNNIISALNNSLPRNVAVIALKRLAEFMVFDALIGNTDRHHENWGMRFAPEPTETWYPFNIVPSYDHASALGRECLDERREKILRENKVGDYLLAARGGVYWQAADAKGVSPLKLVELAAVKYPTYFSRALFKMCRLTKDKAWQVISRVPPHLASEISKQFAHSIICCSLNELKRIQT